jgi:hypothetical protein
VSLEPGEERASEAGRGAHSRGDIVRGASFASIAFVVACGTNAPWEEGTGGTPRFATESAVVPAPEPSAELVASSGRLESGGIFVSCRSGLVVTGDAARDVSRLGLACGPVAGMKRVGASPFEGVLSIGGADLEFPLHLEKSRCYRIFVASEVLGAEIAVDVVSGHGLPIASEAIDGGLGSIPATRPLCALGDDDVVIRASMRCATREAAPPCPRTGLRFAVEVWAR